ncbi:ABC transporter ATP-binding protein [Dyella terrae]|nr:ABC transporter ATP-binding protein [Dyella terrae]
MPPMPLHASMRCWIARRRRAMDERFQPGQSPDAMLHEDWRGLPGALLRGRIRRVVAYVLLSLATASTGTLAALCVVPLIQSGPLTLPFVGHGWAFGTLAGRIAVFVAASSCFGVLRWWTTCLGADLVTRCGLRLRSEVHASLQSAPLRELQRMTSAEVAHALTHNIETLTQGFSALLQLFIAGITAVLSLAVALWLSPGPSLIAIVVLAAAMLVSRMSSREQAQVNHRYVGDMTSLFWRSEDFPRRWRHVHSFGRRGDEQAAFEANAARLGDGYKAQLLLIGRGRLYLEMLAVCGMAAIFWLALGTGNTDRASLIAVCLLLGRLLPYLTTTRQSLQQLRSAIPAWLLWRRFSQWPIDESDVLPGRPALIDIEQVALARPVPVDLRHLNLRPGEMTLVSGDSGIGKSSLMDVLAGLMEPVTFRATMDGRTAGFTVYRQHVRHGAYVGQGVRLWHRTVRDALAWVTGAPTDARFLSVLDDVGLTRPGILETLVNSLSGGETQRVALAQVLLREPRLAILDEATGALDAASELTVLRRMKERLTQTIIVVVSHRPGVRVLAEQVVYLGASSTVEDANGASARETEASG